MTLPPLTLEGRLARLEEIRPLAVEVQETYGFPAPLCAAQYALESYFGLGDELPPELNNLFGQKAIGPDPYAIGTRKVVSMEWDGTRNVPVASTFYAYPDARASFLAHGFYCTGGDKSVPDAEAHWVWQRYRLNQPTSLDPLEWARWLCSGATTNPGGPTYATDPQYVDKLGRIIGEYGLASWGALDVPPPPTPTPDLPAPIQSASPGPQEGTPSMTEDYERTHPVEGGGVEVPTRALDADGDGRGYYLTAEASEVAGLVSIPPLARTILYYVLALANGVAVPLAAAGVVDGLVVLIILNVASVFGFTLAANRVPAE